jgi:uncharacterized membrane protein YqiK
MNIILTPEQYEARREKARAYREAHRAEIRARQKAWKERNRSHVQAYARRWYASHREQAMAGNARWKEQNIQKIRAYDHARYQANRDVAIVLGLVFCVSMLFLIAASAPRDQHRSAGHGTVKDGLYQQRAR